MKTAMDRIVGLKQRRPRKILYWLALSKYTGKMLDQHQNIAILRAKFGDSCTYKPIS